MTASRRAVLAAAFVGASGLAACGTQDQRPGTQSQAPGEEPTTPEEDPVTGGPADELAEPDPDDLLPAELGLVFDDGMLHAPSHTEFLSWSTDGRIAERFSLPEVGVGEVWTWDQAGGVVALNGEGEFSVLVLERDTSAVLGTLAIANLEHDPGDTAPQPAFLGPSDVATDGTLVASAFHSDGVVRVCDVEGNVVSEFRPGSAGTEPSFCNVVWAPSGLLVTHSAREGHPVQFWDARSGSLDRMLEGSPPNPQQVVFASDAPRMVVTQYTQDVAEMPYKVFDTDADEVVGEAVLPDIASAIALSPDGTLLATAGGFGSGKAMRLIHVTDLDTGEVFTMERESYVARALVFSPDGGTLYSHNNRAGIVAWDLASRGQTITFDLPD